MSCSSGLQVSELSPTEYHSYYEPYIVSLGNVGLMDAITCGLDDISHFALQIPDSKMNYSYADGKWSIAEVLVHLIDTERIFQYRALRFARNDKRELQGFDQDFYVPQSLANTRSKKDIVGEWMAVRNSSIALFNSLGEIQLKRSGSANGTPISVRALGFVICGHQAHHFRILKERYLA
ncbi:MAG: DinB family protein [Bacteroidota bacterium]